MGDVISFQEYPIWQVIGQARCRGKVFLNDFWIGSFDGKRNITVQIGVNPGMLRQGQQSLRVELAGDCAVGQLSTDQLSLKLAGFKEGEDPSSSGHAVLRLAGRRSQTGGQWPAPSAWAKFDVLTINESLRREAREFLARVHEAVRKGDAQSLEPLMRTKIRAAHGDPHSPQIASEMEDFKLRVQSRFQRPGAAMLPLPAGEWSYRLLAEGKVLEVTDAQGGALIRWTPGGPAAPELSWKFLLAKEGGSWILY